MNFFSLNIHNIEKYEMFVFLNTINVNIWILKNMVFISILFIERNIHNNRGENSISEILFHSDDVDKRL